MRALLALAILLPLAAGCLGDDSDHTDTGHYVSYRWGNSQKSCQNNVCTYGDNHDSYTNTLRCDSPPTLSWDAANWIHGSVTATILDDAGAEAATHKVTANGGGSTVVPGKTGTWTFKATTDDANGQAELRLTC